MPPYKRKIRLVRPKLQLRLVLTFLGLSALALALQFVMLAALLSDVAADLPADGPVLLEQLPNRLLWVLAFSFGVCLPLTFCVGVVVTFRFAGPIYRFEKYLEGLARGEQVDECRLRRGDELQEFCALLNRATAKLRVEPHAEPVEPARSLDEAA